MTANETPIPVVPAKKAATPAKSGGKRGPQSKAVIEEQTEARVRAEMEADFERRLAEKEAALRKELSAPDDIDERVAAAVAKAVSGLPQAAAVAVEQALDPTTAEFNTVAPQPISADDVNGDPNVQGSIQIHFRSDGHTALGKVWYVGEELILTPGTREWELALLNDGTDRVFAQLDEFEQMERWGEERFRQGPWRGRGLNLDDPNLDAEERARLAEVQRKRLTRTAVPLR